MSVLKLIPVNRRKTALILKLGQIGDVIMAIPAVYALYKQGFEIHWMCGRAAQPLLKYYSWISVIPINDKAILRGSPLERMVHIADLWRKVAFRRYEFCATLYYDRRFHFVSWPIWARRKLSLSRDSRERMLLAGRHHTDEYVRILLDIKDGFQERSNPPIRPNDLPPSPLPQKRTSRRVAIVPGGASNVLSQQVLRRWPVQHYVSLTRSLLDRGWEVVLLGGEEDVWVRSHFEQLDVYDAIGTLALPQVISACDECDAVISHDTGPLHLAGLSKACLIGIFGPTDPGNFLPRRSSVVGIWGGQGFACRPCYDGRNFAPCQFNGCMHQVTPDLVLRELDQLFEERAQGTPKPWRIVTPEGTSPTNDLVII